MKLVCQKGFPALSLNLYARLNLLLANLRSMGTEDGREVRKDVDLARSNCYELELGKHFLTSSASLSLFNDNSLLVNFYVM